MTQAAAHISHISSRGITPGAHIGHATRQKAKVVPTHEMSGQIAPAPRFAPKNVGHTSTLVNVENLFAKRVLESIKQHSSPEQLSRHIKQAVHYIRHRHLRAMTDQAALRRYLRRLSRGNSAYELALLEGIQIITAADSLFDDLGYRDQDIIKSFILDHEAALQAYLNIASTLTQHSYLGHANELVAAYQEIMVTSTSVLCALAATIAKLGEHSLESWSRFLRQAAVADLTAMDVGADKVHLMFVLAELKSLQVLSTLHSFLKDLATKRLPNLPGTSLLTTLQFASNPISTMSVIEKWIAACQIPEQILFLQDYRNVLSRISSTAYKNEEEQQNAKTVLQKRIDHLIYCEED